MSLTKIIIPVIAAFLFITACSEEKRMITPSVPEGSRVILLEEFTGKGCTNCPKGSREIENLLSQFPDNLIAVSIHAGFFANPEFFPLGQYDLRTEEGEFLYTYIGAPVGYPAGSINRTVVGNDLQLSLNQWASEINQQIQEEPVVEIAVTTEFNEATRELTVHTTTVGKENLQGGELRLSIMLTESGIVDAQDDIEAGGIVDDYVHNHVLRDMLTPAAGETIGVGVLTGQVISKTHTITLAENWKPGNMEVIAFVSRVAGDEIPILQAASAHVIE
jgi:hypothetical protein